MLVQMITTAASPSKVLESGKTYNLGTAEAKMFIAAGAARLGTGKPTRVPPQPDPEDVPDVPEDDEATESEE